MANSLKTLRRLRSMTQEELSAKTGITARTIQNYENNLSSLRKASYENLVALAGALNVSIDDIFLDDISEFLKLPK
ncbi:TPA: helix-turn-helix transcriptional regulator [Streptococcus suis]|nr:helix-turn-helix transcriptional regulator [Streptococcus suis]HEP1844926.1 helix-turn-helix transcriptional regulator [Streptococcus suis]